MSGCGDLPGVPMREPRGEPSPLGSNRQEDDRRRFISLLLTALALAPALPHLLELPHKIHLSREEYLTIQQIYRGWSLLGIVVVGALLSAALPLHPSLRRQRMTLPGEVP